MADSKLIWASTRPADGGGGGVFFRRELGAPMPVMADAPWDDLETDHWIDLGWIGDDGISNGVKRDTTDHQAFGGDVVKTTQDKYTETLKVTFYQTDPNVLGAVFGDDNVTSILSAGHRQITVEHSSLPLERACYVARVVDGVKTRLLCVKEGQIINVDDIVHVNKDLVKYTVTICCYKPDADTEAVVEFIDEPDVHSGS